MPRKPRSPGSGKSPHNGPARGAGKGEGWGGPAKGVGAPPLQPAGDEYSDAIRAASHAPDIKRRNAERREKVLALYESIMDDTQAPPMARITAGDKLLDRIDGKPVQTNINLGADEVERLSDDELAAERERVAAALAAARQARAEAGDKAQPGGVVH